MRFAVVDPARNGRPRTGSLGRIEAVDVEAEMNAVGSVTEDAQGLIHHIRHSLADAGRLPPNLGKQRVALSEIDGQRHAVNIAARARVLGIQIAVGVEPDDAKMEVMSRQSGDRADGDAVIATENERKPPAGGRGVSAGKYGEDSRCKWNNQGCWSSSCSCSHCLGR